MLLTAHKTGWRTRPDEAWNWLQPGQSTVMQHHWKITMDYNYPEQAVFKLADGKLANDAGPCWQYVSQYAGGQGGQARRIARLEDQRLGPKARARQLPRHRLRQPRRRIDPHPGKRPEAGHEQVELSGMRHRQSPSA